MALVHDATLSPTKQELMAAWLPGRPWAGGHGYPKKLAEYRFDDPAGEVGIETVVLTDESGTTVHVPLTYRGAPLAGADDFLVGTSDHSVLGPRWIYDGCGDPVWAAALATAIVTGGAQAQMYFEEDGKRIDVPPRMSVRGSGGPGAEVPTIVAVDSVHEDGPITVVRSGDLELVVARVVGTPLQADETLTGVIGTTSAVLAGLRRTS